MGRNPQLLFHMIPAAAPRFVSELQHAGDFVITSRTFIMVLLVRETTEISVCSTVQSR
jgi:hypothetical protein